jgi:methyl-accepting chemotaxis protein
MIFLFSACLVLVYVCFGAIVFRASHAVSRQNFYEMAVAQLQRVEERINTFMSPGFMATDYLASTEVIKSSRGLLTSYLDTQDRVTLLYENHPPHEKRVYMEFMMVKRYNSNFDLVFMANNDGQYAQAPEGRYKAAGYDPRKRSWYKELMASPHDSVVSSPYLTTGADIVCSLMTKTTDNKGAPLGMVGVDYTLTNLTTDLSERRILKTGYLVIFDPSNHIVIDGRHPEFIGMTPEEVREKSLGDAQNLTAEENSLRESLELRHRLVTGNDGEYTGRGDENHRKYAVTFTMPKLQWKLAVIFEQDELMEASYSTLMHILASAIPLFAVTLFLTGYFAFRISQPIKKMVDHLSRLALGDITADVPSDDLARRDEIGLLARSMQDMIESSRNELEVANALAQGDYTYSMPLRSDVDMLGRALKSMMNTTVNTLSRVIHLVDTVNHGAEIVAGSSQSLTNGAQTSAGALDDVSKSITQIDQQARDNALNIQEANKFADISRNAAQRGYHAMNDLTTSLADFQKSGQKIRDVVKLIDDIAFQTNLLSLNAAVEAARAGRHGRGFSVVAEEVRNLAARSAKAARDTGAMVEAMMQQMSAGIQLSVRSDKEFKEIVETVDKVAHLFEHIAEASSGQSSAISEIVHTLGQIGVIITNNNQQAAHLSQSAVNLSHQAEELRNSVSHFQMSSTAIGKAAGDNQLPATHPPLLDRQLS